MTDFSKPCEKCVQGKHNDCAESICGCIRDHVGDDAVVKGFKRIKRELHPERESWTIE